MKEVGIDVNRPILLKIFMIIGFIVLGQTRSIALENEQIKVTFINPGFQSENPTGNFWRNVSRLMETTALDLNMILTIHYAKRNHIVMKELIRQALRDNTHYLILVDEKGAASSVLLNSKFKHKKIFFLLNSPNHIVQSKIIARGHSLVGTMVPDNIKAGEQLATHLFHQSGLEKKRIKIMALLGDIVTKASLDREKGLMQSLEENRDIELIGKFHGNWSEEEALSITHAMLTRHPETNIIWCANDAMAFGASKAASILNLREKLTIGGINWDIGHEREIDVSFGGHVLLGAFALSKIYKIENKNSQPEKLKLDIFTPYTSDFYYTYKAIHNGFPNHLKVGEKIIKMNINSLEDINTLLQKNNSLTD